MFNNLKEKIDIKTIENVRERKYFSVISLIFLICILAGELVNIVVTIYSGDWSYYFSLDRVIDSILFYIFLTVAFTIIVIIRIKKKISQK